HIIPDDFKSDSGKLLDYYFDNKIDILDGTPVLVDLISDKLGESSKRLAVKELIIGGDSLLSSSVQQLVNQIGNNNIPKITNVYGPTESCVDSTLYNYLITDDTVSGIMPVGKPLFNTQIYILDKYLKIVPMGVTGELCISGYGLARGYLNRDDLTAEKFIDNPYIPGERMYRTGDLARWQQDGNIEFLGRIDNQVKIRGFRIELGEIENSFVQHKDIGSAVVVAKTALDGDKQLIAYYSGQKELEILDIRAYLGKSLPGYMIPSYFVFMERFPMTPNGKIDRKVLPEPGGCIKTGVEYIAPRDDIEEKLVEIWQEALGIEKIGVLDNFFDLGGHSLKAVKLVSRIYRDFSYQLQLRDLFEKSTVSELAELISSDKENNMGKILVPIQSDGTRNPLFLVPGSMGDVFCFSSLGKSLGNDQPVYGLQAVGLDGISKPIDNIEKMAESYILSIKSVQEKGPYQIGGHSFGGLVAFEICRQLETLGDQVELLMLFDSYPDKSGELEFNEENQLLSFISQISKLYDIDLDIDIERITGKKESERWKYVDRILVENEIHLPIDMIKGKWDVNKTNCTMRSSPQVQLSPGSVILFNANEGRLRNNDSDWGNYFTTEVNTYEISGNHFTMLDEPNVAEIVDILKELEDQRQKISTIKECK
ncbi:MAG: AMP-binding protein, partial [Deltaproteobacteria bacterium]|nr:AMP-binding protein [Deltaproteobacteria bacterium]